MKLVGHLLAQKSLMLLGFEDLMQRECSLPNQAWLPCRTCLTGLGSAQ